MNTTTQPLYIWNPEKNGKTSLMGSVWLTWLTIVLSFSVGIYLILDGFAEYEPYSRLGGALLVGGSLLLLVIHLLGYHPENHLVIEADGTMRWRLSRAEETQTLHLDNAVAMRHRAPFSRTTVMMENGKEYVIPTRNIYDSSKRRELVELLDERLNQPAMSTATS